MPFGARKGLLTLIRIVAGLALSVVLSWQVAADERPLSFPRQLQVLGERLVLNGYGERERWMMDVYGCALYLPEKSASLDYILSPDTPSAIRIVVNYNPPSDPPDRWESTFRQELSRELLGRMMGVYDDLEAGDVVMFAYAPGHGTKALLNGRRLFTDRGHGLMAALLDQWLGPRPVSKNLRRLLLQ